MTEGPLVHAFLSELPYPQGTFELWRGRRIPAEGGDARAVLMTKARYINDKLRIYFESTKLTLEPEPLHLERERYKNLGKNTQQSYKKQYKGFAGFCVLVGDFESLMCLHYRCLVLFPSMKTETIAEYIRYKR